MIYAKKIFASLRSRSMIFTRILHTGRRPAHQGMKMTPSDSLQSVIPDPRLQTSRTGSDRGSRVFVFGIFPSPLEGEGWGEGELELRLRIPALGRSQGQAFRRNNRRRSQGISAFAFCLVCHARLDRASSVFDLFRVHEDKRPWILAFARMTKVKDDKSRYFHTNDAFGVFLAIFMPIAGSEAG